MKKRSIIKSAAVLTLVLACAIACAASVSAASSHIGIRGLAGEVSLVKGGISGEDITFETADFRRALCVSKVKSVTIESLPDSSDGILKLGSVRVAAGQSISSKNLELLTFSPSHDGVEEASFTFSVPAQSGGAEITCNIRYTEKINFAPAISVSDGAMEVSTHENVTAHSTLLGSDPEGDEVEFIITSYPTRGRLELTNKASGEYRYTPASDYTGKDSFTYVVRDYYGNYSKECKVMLRVEECEIDLVYADMADSPAYNAALTLAEKNIMLGKLLGGGMYFTPEGVVSREEFVVMAMKAAGVPPLSSVANTYFDDNDDISAATRPYIAAAQRYGYVVGTFTEEGLCFSPEENITRGEAAVIVSRILGLKSGGESEVFSSDEALPTWMISSVGALMEADIYPTSSGAIAASAPLTRADSAIMLAGVIDMLDK